MFIYLFSKLNKPKYKFGLLLTCVVLVWSAVFSLPDNQLHVVFLDVGQGDSILITTPSGKTILVDGGFRGSLLPALSEFLPFYQRSIDLLVATHPHADHIGGLVDVLEVYDVSAVVWNPSNCDLGECATFWDLASDQEFTVLEVDAGDRLNLEPGIWLQVIGPSDTECLLYESNANNCSVVLRLVYRDFSVFLSGDAEVEQQEQWHNLGPATVLKSAHHGALNGLYLPVFEVLDPELVVVSVGKNSFGHPSPQVLDVYIQANIEYLRTDEVGSVEVVSDGRSWYTKSNIWNNYKRNFSRL